MAAENPLEHPLVAENPAYGVGGDTRQHRVVLKARPMSVVVMEQPVGDGGYIDNEEDRIGKSSRWDHHITFAVVITVLSVFALNFVGLFCGVAGIYFAFKARVASRNDLYLEKIAYERSSFASVILCIIMWILTWCIAGFTVHAIFCGLTGQKCETRTHV